MKPAIAALLALPALAIAQPTEPQADELLQIVYPKWTDEEGGRVQSIKTNAVTRGWDTRQGKQRKVAIEPRQVVRVAPDRILLLAAMTPVGEGGGSQVWHGSPIGLAAYTFKPGKDGWTVDKRQEPFDLQGFEGQAQMEVVPLAQNAQALHVTWGSCWQGHCVDLFALYAIGKDGVVPRPLVQERIKGGNVYARPDCVDRLGVVLRGLQPGDPAGANDPVPPGKCYAVEGRWEIAAGSTAPGELTIRFTGAISNASQQANLPARRVDQAMKFEFRGGRYVPVSGSNPVPGV